MQHHAVLIYTREDTDIAHRIRDDMRAAGLTVWTDEDLDPGTTEWQEAIENAIGNAGCVVVILSPEANNSERVKQQLDYAFARDVRIFPILAQGDSHDAFPKDLAQTQYIDLRKYDAAAIQALIAEIGRNTLQAGPPEPGFEEMPQRRVEPPADTGAIPKKEEKPEPPAPPPPPQPAPASPPAARPAPAPAQPRQEAPMYPQPAAPTRSRGGWSLPTPTFGSKPSVSVEPVEFTGFWPQRVQPQKSYALMVFAHLKGAASEVRDVAAGFAEMMGGTQTSGSAPSQIQVATHTLLTFVPQVEGLTFQPAEQSLIWEPRFQSVTFLFNVPGSDNTTFAGRILIFEGPLVIGEIPVTMQVVSTVITASIAETPLHRIEPIFASYSHRDTPVIEYFRKTRSRLGQKMLVDVYDLRAGEHWADRLLEMIDESALFQLFWSEHSAQSQYVKQEWQHALRHLPTRPRFIQPVWWDAPMHPPPPELAHLHFQRIGLPPVTRLQVALSKVRGLLGR